MQISLDTNREIYGIISYQPGELTITLPLDEMTSTQSEENADRAFGNTVIRKETLTQSTVIMPTSLIRGWSPGSFDELEKKHFDQLTEYHPEIILFGSGPTLRWPEPAMVSTLTNSGIGFEVMDTSAACRTYNILVSDQRHVAAALLLK